MGKFDANLWRQRATARFNRAVARRGVDKAKRKRLDEAWTRDIAAIDDLSTVIGWCAERCIDVGFVKKPLGDYQPTFKEINISSRLAPTNQVVVLLHECGHHLVGDVQEGHARFGMGYPQSDAEVLKTMNHRVAVLEEELEAWHRGWKLAQRLCLSVPREVFDEMRLRCVKTYMQWVLNPGRKRVDYQ